MKPKEIQDLIDFIAQSGLQEVNIETEQFKLKVKKNIEAKTVVEKIASSPAQSNSNPLMPVAPLVQSPAEQPAKLPEAETTNYVSVKSPMIGTFYRSASPEAEPFIKVGDKIEPGDTVCMVEAMKLFNEIEAEIAGTVVKVLVDNASPVEYDQDLFLVEPS